MLDSKQLQFDGAEWIVFQKSCEIQNTFTYEFWVKAEEEQVLDLEKSAGNDGLTGKKYLVGPDLYPYGAAGCGISVGTNGIAIYEHSDNHIPARLVYPYHFSDWTHVAVVSDHKKLRLYINGRLVKEEGAACVIQHLHPSLCLGGHQYGTFKGQVSDFRLWSTVRTEYELKTSMLAKLNGDETGLYFYRDLHRGISVHQGKLKPIAVSIIMPSYNRCPLNHYALLSLNKQRFPLQQMEVIFLNDHSTDSTESLYRLLEPKYTFIYVHSLKNRGRAKIRNRGAKIAAGSTFIFIDADMICGPAFVKRHLAHHVQEDQKIVSGSLRMRRIYTIADREFSAEQIVQMKSSYSGHPIAPIHINRFIKEDHAQVQLLPLEMMFDPAHLNRWSSGIMNYESILSKYGSRFQQYQYPWMNLITNNVSMRRSFFEKLDGFDEHFQGFGWEDWELGYRAAGQGAAFIHDDSVINYHQEHPIAADTSLQAKRNYLKFHEKNPHDPAVKLLTLIMLPDPVGFTELSQYMTDYNNLKAAFPSRFKAFYSYMDSAIDALPERLKRENSNIPIQQSIQVSNELSIIQKKFAFPSVMEFYRRITR
ncbi:glycosyltransferase [Paenibacillus pasadenensis]|uniref:glycosyltransferase n=1 Tax=Paenibacillus pasadenensis TaxID=217090 RepID=UPI00203A7F36|nr:glycosyltransferase [Paenibacillus pasadenensis]MCM3748797.1 glycosyltransferase [Paenibacillus pasadenensis]